DVLVVIGQGQALRLGKSLLELGGELVHAHGKSSCCEAEAVRPVAIATGDWAASTAFQAWRDTREHGRLTEKMRNRPTTRGFPRTQSATISGLSAPVTRLLQAPGAAFAFATALLRDPRS